ncbi:MAG: GTP-binding protein [archaeon]|nr:GTP-binding protein [archaeon]
MSDDYEGTAISCKVVLIGESGVGKTSIMERFINNVFSSVLMSTTGASFKAKLMDFPEDHTSIKFDIWDTAGQEKFRSLAKVFYKNASACIVVYDITRKTSFEEIKKYWVKELRENISEDVGNKIKIKIILL